VWRNIEFLNVDPPSYVIPEERQTFDTTKIAESPLNVLIYLIDTVRRDHLEIYGYERSTTPSLANDRSEWFIYEDCQSLSSWTKAATATLLTGVDPVVHGAIDDDDTLSTDVALLWEPLHDAGFETALFTSNGHVSERWGFARKIDHYLHFPERKARRTLHISADSLHAAFVHWLDTRRSTAPFLAYIHATDPHIPYTPPRDLISAFYPDNVKRLDEFSVEMLAAMICSGVNGSESVEAARALYDAEIAGWDRAFAGLLDSLAVRELLDNTVVLVTSDHGEEFGEHGGFSHGMTLYREQLEVPLLVRVPNYRGERVQVPMDQRDVADLVYWVLSGQDPKRWRPKDRNHRISHLSLRGLEVARFQTPSFTVLWNVMPMKVCGRRAPGVEMYMGDELELLEVSAKRQVSSRACRGALLEWLRRLPSAEARMSRLDEEMIQRLRYLGYLTDE
jgi:arylsulfatase